MRTLSLAAGTLLTCRLPEAVRAAHAAGFSTVGVRLFGPTAPTAAEVASAKHLVADLGMAVLDAEVVRITAGDQPGDADGLLDTAADLGARWVLVVSDDPDRARTIHRLGEVATRASARGMRTALEFMRFTTVATLADALAVVDATGRDDVRVVVDALHLARSGGSPAEVAASPPARLAYAQLCDAPVEAPPDGDLATEARHHRRFPGEGGLALVPLLRALPPDLAVAVEVQSDEAANRPPADIAVHSMTATQRVLAGLVPPASLSP